MFKKKLNILLLLSLALLFTSLLSSTCFAREISKDELKNFIINYYHYYYGDNKDDTDIRNYIDNTIDTQIGNIVSSISASQGRYILSGSYGKITYWIYDGNSTNLAKEFPYRYNTNRVYVNTSYLSRWYQTIDIRDGYYNYINWTGGEVYVGTQGNNNNYYYFFYTDTNIRSNPTESTKPNGTNAWNAGYETPSGIFDGPYTQDFFNYAPSSLIPEINLNNSFYFSETAQEILFVYNPFSRKRSKHC